jgi:hypothetical protein
MNFIGWRKKENFFLLDFLKNKVETPLWRKFV